MLAQAAQVDHARDAGVAGHVGEVGGRLALGLLEVALAAPAHAVDQVVGHVRRRRPRPRGRRRRSRRPRAARRPRPPGPRPCPGRAPERARRARLHQPAGQRAADESRRACDQCLHRPGYVPGSGAGHRTHVHRIRRAPEAGLPWSRAAERREPRVRPTVPRRPPSHPVRRIHLVRRLRPPSSPSSLSPAGALRGRPGHAGRRDLAELVQRRQALRLGDSPGPGAGDRTLGIGWLIWALIILGRGQTPASRLQADARLDRRRRGRSPARD